MNLSQYKNRFNVTYKKEKTGEISSLVQEVKMTQYLYPINENLFFYSQPVINLKLEKNALNVEVEKNNINKLYLSYLTLDNKFNDSPVNSLLNLDEHNKFQFILKLDKENSLEIVPYIIHYQEGKKRKLTSITKPNQLVNFENDDKCRLVFKVTGNGIFTIKEIIIIPKG